MNQLKLPAESSFRELDNRATRPQYEHLVETANGFASLWWVLALHEIDRSRTQRPASIIDIS